uniref:Uncharacterized protein n=1 Tax=viral metagenome TaxID=1070528 RepID=A0A6C0E0J2_9ZZZZ
MAAAIEPFSFLSIILKLLNLSDVKKDTIFSYTGEYIPETKTKTHIIPISLYPILHKQQSIFGNFMDLPDFLKQFGLTKIIADPKFDIQTKEAQIMIEKFSKLIDCKLIFYILDATKVINCIIFNKDSQNSKIIIFANKQYILYTKETEIPETIVKKIILYNDAQIKRHKEFIAKQEQALEQYKASKPAPQPAPQPAPKQESQPAPKQAPKQAPKPAPIRVVTEGASAVPPKLKQVVPEGASAVPEGASAVPYRAMAYEAPEQPIAGLRCDKCFSINKYSYQTCHVCGEVKINPIDKSLFGDNIIYIFQNNGSKEGFKNHCMLISILMFLNKNGYPGLTLTSLRNKFIKPPDKWKKDAEYDEINEVQKEILKQIQDSYEIVIIIYDTRETNKCYFINFSKDDRDRTHYKKCVILQTYGHFSLIDLKKEYAESTPTPYEKFPLLQELSIDYLSQFKGGNLNTTKQQYKRLKKLLYNMNK